MVAVGILSCYLPISPADAALTFKFEYDDQAGTGFLDSVYGPARQAALNTAASTFSTMFGSHFSNSGTITLKATASDDAFSGTMAEAGSMAAPSATPGFNLQEVIRTKLQNGIDLNGDSADGVVKVNFGKPWNVDLSAPTSSDEYDFHTTLYHEFTHTLGFTSIIEEPGASLFGKPSWGAFDSFITDKHGNKIIDPVTFALDQSAWDTAKVGDWAGGGSEGLFFDGPNAVAANGGFRVTLYTPSEWNDGSSVAHLDDRMPGMEGTMMGPSTGTGPRIHDYSAVEVGILTDLGYVPAVPEPETYSMMLAGLVTCAWIARRRKFENFG
jgi:hypothetical protein